MQATLLGVSIAVILALVAALVGPHFVDWSAHRALFEAQAGKLVGAPVRIAGPIDVRLLPTPMLTLRQIALKRDGEGEFTARELHVELALGALVRGEFHASEIRLVGPEFELRLGPDGRLEHLGARLAVSPDQLWIQRFALEDARATLSDAASGARLAVERLWFTGELRSLLGPIKGEGGFMVAGDRFAYRLSASRVGEDGAMRLRLGVDPTDGPAAVEADGTLRFDGDAPRFEGTLTLVRPVVAGTAAARPGVMAVPWRLTSRVKATSARALLENVEYQYGPDERAIRLGGTAEIVFGKAPRLEGLLSARQLDVDRALVLPDRTRRQPLAALKALIEPFGGSYRPPLPVRLGLSVDTMTLAGGTLQGVRGDIRTEAEGWSIETFELRAPGSAQMRVSGRMAIAGTGVTFNGPFQVEANDARALLAWLEGRADGPQAQLGALKAAGELTIGTQGFAVERLRVDLDRRSLEGRLAYTVAPGRPTRLDAALKAAELDVDAGLAFARAALDGSAIERPDEIALAVDINRATMAGVEVKGVNGKFRFDAAGLVFDGVSIADLGGAALRLDGRLDGGMMAPRGNVALDLDARSLDGALVVLTKYWPQAAEPLRRVSGRLTPLKLRANLALDRPASGQSTAKLAFEGNAGTLRVRLSSEATGEPSGWATRLPALRFDGTVGADDGSVLIALLGLDRAVVVDRRPGTLTLSARAVAGGDLRLDARLAAGGLNLTANGTAQPFAAPRVGLDIALQAADASPLRRGVTSTAPLPLSLRTRLNAAGEEIAFDDISGSIGGAPLRGKIKLALHAVTRIDGHIETDALDLTALVASAIGTQRAAAAPRPEPGWSTEPFAEGLFGLLDGRIEFRAARALLAPTLLAGRVRGMAKLGANEIALEEIEGTLGGGRLTAALSVHKGADGALTARGRLALSGSELAALIPFEGKPAVSGRAVLQVEAEGSGLSPATLIGSLNGSGTISLEDGALAGLDPKAFGTVMRAVDQGLVIDASKIRDMVATLLDSGPLAVPALDAAVTINGGELRLSRTIVRGQGADLAIAGSLNAADGGLDARVTLTGPLAADGASTTRPEIAMTLKGPWAAPKRSVDASAFSGWLMVRTVERQAKKIESIEASRREAEPAEAPAPVLQPVPSATDSPPVPTREPRTRPSATPTLPPRAAAPPAADQPPPLPPPLDIGAPGTRPTKGPRVNSVPTGDRPPPRPADGAPQGRSMLETLFGGQR